MSADTGRDRRGFFDLVAQLRRRWVVVVGGGLLGLLVAVGLVQTVAELHGSDLAILIGVVAGLALGFAAGLALVLMQPRVTTADDVRRVTGLPVIAQLPSAVLDVDDLDDDSPTRRLRTALREVVMNTRSLAGGSLPRRMVFARTESPSEAAGVDVGIARALVESGFVPALVETDLAASMLSRPASVGAAHDRGVASSPLSDEALGTVPTPESKTFQSVTVPDRVASARPVDRLSAVEGLLGTLGERYDVTVAQASSESFPVPLRSIAPIADAVIIVVRSNRTTVESLLSLYGELLSIGVQPLGVVMTAVAGRHRVLLRRTWTPTDFRDAAVSTAPKWSADVENATAPDPSPRAGLSIADLVERHASSLSSSRKDPS